MAKNKNKQRGDTCGPRGRHRRACSADGAGAGLTAARLDSLCIDDNEVERVRVHCFCASSICSISSRVSSARGAHSAPAEGLCCAIPVVPVSCLTVSLLLSVQTLSCARACASVQESEQPEGNYLQLGSVKLHCVDGEVHMVSNLKRRHVHVVRTLVALRTTRLLVPPLPLGCVHLSTALLELTRSCGFTET